MNQEDQHEKSEEVPKMGKYYDNASLTLINMNAEMGDLMFMFDDLLVDGRAMAGTWALNQLAYVEGVYYRDGYNSEQDKVELTLTQALHAIKNRKRTVALDGIYSILEDNNPQDTLYEIMKVAVANDENGSTSVMGSIGKISCKFRFDNRNFLEFTEEGITITNNDGKFPHYTILPIENQNIHKLEGGFEIEGGFYRKDAIIKLESSQQEPMQVSLLGTRKTLALAKENCSLTVIYKELFQTSKLFALLLEQTEKEGVYHRLGLVELGNNEQIKCDEETFKYAKQTTIGASASQVNLETNQELGLQTQIQVDPK
ncbi:13382_t:CDS:2 [Funneliformis geosporum]|nr:13382_t:CDS:2 [Funneliformis geosporum]